MSEPNHETMRVARILYTPEMLQRLVSGQYEVVSNKLPADAHIVSAGWHAQQRVFFIDLESASFDLVELGKVIPLLSPPSIRRIATEA